MLLNNCATVVWPDGGPTDKTAPKIASATPSMNETGFSGQKLVFEFDEYITTSNFLQELVISPPVKGKVSYKVVSKNLIIKLPEALRPNTTYSVYFGDGVVDLTSSKNKLADNRFVFSTGNTIDSCRIVGTVKDAFSGEPEERILVGLYKWPLDTGKLDETPSYIANTDKSGKFEISNVAHGDYFAFALQDIDVSYTYNIANEKIGFYPTAVSVSDSTQKIAISTFVSSISKQAIKGKLISNRYYGQIALNQPTDTFTISGSEKILNSFLSPTKDTVNLLFESPIKPTDEFILKHSGQSTDTIRFTFSEEKTSDKLIHPLLQSIAPLDSTEKDLLISSLVPIEKWDTSRISVIDGNDTLRLASTKQLSPNRFSFQTNKKVKNSLIRIDFYPGAFEYLGATNTDTLSLKSPIVKESDLGDLKVKLTSVSASLKGAPVIIEVYKDKTIKRRLLTTLDQPEIEIGRLTNGKYKLKMIVDTNQNHRWDAGDFHRQISPEKCFLSSEATVKADWDSEFTWDLSE